jgi:hypothetical protein
VTLLCPDVRVNGDAVPIVAPDAFRNDTVPLQEAAVPEDVLFALFTRMISAVSVLPSPVGGKVTWRVFVVVVCPITTTTETARSSKPLKMIMVSPPGY